VTRDLFAVANPRMLLGRAATSTRVLDIELNRVLEPVKSRLANPYW